MSESVQNPTAYIIVTGNEKGGCGKTTITMHLAVSLLYEGMKVATIDLDARQRSLSRYIENRLQHAENIQAELPHLSHFVVKKSDLNSREEAQADERERFEKCLSKAVEENDVVIIDAPGNDTYLSRLAHSHADTIVTPINDSFIDLDVLAHIKEETLDMSRPGIYSETVWQAKMQRAKRDRGEIDWVVLRNRLSNLDAHNKRQMSDALEKLSRKTGCRIAQGFSERVIYRELFLKGLTLLDVIGNNSDVKPRMTHIAARQELRELVHFLDLSYRIRQKLGHDDNATQSGGAPKNQDEALSSQEEAQQHIVASEESHSQPLTQEPLPSAPLEDASANQEIEHPHRHYSLEELSKMEEEIEAREGVVDRLEDLQVPSSDSVFDADQQEDPQNEDEQTDVFSFDETQDLEEALPQEENLQTDDALLQTQAPETTSVEAQTDVMASDPGQESLQQS